MLGYSAVVESSNTYGILKILSTHTNTIISCPWKGYTENNLPVLNEFADHLVKPRNLTVGDELLLLGPDNQTYASWMLETEVNSRGLVEGRWTPMTNVSKRNWKFPDYTDPYVTFGDPSNTLTRGYGVWLIRQNPLNEDGTPKPIYVHGQWTKIPQSVVIMGTNDFPTLAGPYDMAAYTMLANPDCTIDTWLGDYEWPDGENDTIIINTDHNATRYVFHQKVNSRRGAAPDKRWCWCESRSEMIGSTSVMRSIYHYSDVEADREYFTIPKGVGFWYVRRTGESTLFTWNQKSK